MVDLAPNTHNDKLLMMRIINLNEYFELIDINQYIWWIATQKYSNTNSGYTISALVGQTVLTTMKPPDNQVMFSRKPNR